VIGPNTKCIFKGFNDPPDHSEFLCDSVRHGRLYATSATMKVHPLIENDVMLGGCAVVFVRKKSQTYVVLVQVKGRHYLMNPAGHRNPGETYRECAVRETKEETGLVIENLHPLAIWEFKSGYGGLQWDARTMAFYATCDCPEDWELGESVNRIDIIDDEVDYLLVVDVKSLDRTELGGHHLNLVNEACRRLNPLPYLDSFRFTY